MINDQLIVDADILLSNLHCSDRINYDEYMILRDLVERSRRMTDTLNRVLEEVDTWQKLS